MRSRLLGGLAATAFLALAGCGDQETRSPSEPRPAFSHIGLSTCNLAFNSLISQYFTQQSRQQTVQNLRQEMAADYAADNAEEVNDDGFAILANIEAAVNLGESSNATLGTQLVRRVLDCMFTTTEPAGLNPDTVDFSQELTVHGLGGFAVRWKDPTSPYYTENPVVSHDGFAATAPEDGNTWSNSLTETILIYGERATATASNYDWHKIRVDAAFARPLVIAFCGGTSVSLVNERAEGATNGTYIPFVDPDYLLDYLLGSGFCPSVGPPPSAAKGDSNGWGVLALARQLRDLFRATPAQASMLVSHGTTAGRGGYSHFTLGSVPQVILKVPSPPPPSNPPVGFKFDVTVRAQTPAPDNSPVDAVCVAVFGINNNGAQKALVGTHTCDLPAELGVTPSTPTAVTGVGGTAGTATLSVCATDPGGLRFLAVGKVQDRNSINVTNGLSSKINVKPSTATCQ